jgi:hypothetical protein
VIEATTYAPYVDVYKTNIYSQFTIPVDFSERFDPSGFGPAAPVGFRVRAAGY